MMAGQAAMAVMIPKRRTLVEGTMKLVEPKGSSYGWRFRLAGQELQGVRKLKRRRRQSWMLLSDCKSTIAKQGAGRGDKA
jgi:hypothetical protein